MCRSIGPPSTRRRSYAPTLPSSSPDSVVSPAHRVVHIPPRQLTAYLRQHIAQTAQRVVHLLCQFLQIVVLYCQFPRQHLFAHHVEVSINIGVQHGLLTDTIQYLFRQHFHCLHNVRQHAHQPVFCTRRGPFFPQTGKPLSHSSQYIFVVHHLCLITKIVSDISSYHHRGLQRYKKYHYANTPEWLII